MTLPSRSLRSFGLRLVFLLGTVLGGASAQDDAQIGAKAVVLPIRLVDGHVILSATLYDQTGADDAVSLELVLDSADGLTLHSDQLNWLKIDAGALKKGREIFTRVTFPPGVSLQFPARDIKAEPSGEREEAQNRLTRLFPGPLDERKVKGTLGLGLLKNYTVALDLAAKTLSLTPRTTAAPAETAETPADGDFTGAFALKDGRLILPVSTPLGQPATMILGSSAYDTLIDLAFAKQAGKPAGDVQPMILTGQGGFDLAQAVAFRPKAWRGSGGAEGAVLLSGVNFLELFRLEIDWDAARVRLTRQNTPPAQTQADRAYFAAEAAGDADAFLAFLEANPKSRLGADAARRLIALRLEEWGATDAAIIRALQWLADTSPPERRTENCLVYVDKLSAQPGRTALTIQATLLALKYARQALTVQDIYRLHRILGEQYLELGDLQSAWTHLLSAAFVPVTRNGRPDAEQAFRVALNLGRVYERQDRFVRAYSRYKAALAVPGAPLTAAVRKEITEAMERLRAKIPAEQLKMIDS